MDIFGMSHYTQSVSALVYYVCQETDSFGCISMTFQQYVIQGDLDAGDVLDNIPARSGVQVIPYDLDTIIDRYMMNVMTERPERRVISGGQTGADQGGLLGARDAGYITGGYAPFGYRTENGPMPQLRSFGLIELKRSSYSYRTRKNIKVSDVTILFGSAGSIGSNLTRNIAHAIGKPLLHIRSPDIKSLGPALVFLRTYDPSIINIAGNRESVTPGIQDGVRSYVREMLLRW